MRLVSYLFSRPRYVLGRECRNQTCDLLLPKQAHYLAVLIPAIIFYGLFLSEFLDGFFIPNSPWVSAYNASSISAIHRTVFGISTCLPFKVVFDQEMLFGDFKLTGNAGFFGT